MTEPERPQFVVPGEPATPPTRGRGRPRKSPPWVAPWVEVRIGQIAGGGYADATPPPAEGEPAWVGPYRALAGMRADEPVAVALHRTRSYCVEVVGASVGSPYVAPPTPFAVRVGAQAVYGARYAWLYVPDSTLIAEVRWSRAGDVLETSIAQHGPYDRSAWLKNGPRIERALARFLGRETKPGPKVGTKTGWTDDQFLERLRAAMHDVEEKWRTDATVVGRKLGLGPEAIRKRVRTATSKTWTNYAREFLPTP